MKTISQRIRVCAGVALISLITAFSNAETVQMTLTGTFNSNTGNGHPDIHIGDTFYYRTTFQRTALSCEGCDTMSVGSAAFLTSEFKVNGSAHAYTPIGGFIFYGDYPYGSRSAKLSGNVTFPYGLNRVSFNLILDYKVNTPVGETVQFDDFYVLNGWDLAYGAPWPNPSTTFTVYGTNASLYSISGPVTSCSVICISAPTILSQSSGQTNAAGSSTTLTVNAKTTGCDLGYQWRHNGVEIPGATGSALQFNSVLKSDVGIYDVVVTNRYATTNGSVVSSPITFGVTVADPFAEVAGIYNGLFYDTNSVTHHSAGFVTMKFSTNKLAYSGKFMFDGDVIPFAGKFPTNGILSTNVSRAKFGKSDLNLDLSVDMVTWSDKLTGTLSEPNSWTSSITADLALFNKTNITTAFAKTHTMLIPGFTNLSDGPRGYGYATLYVTTNGLIKPAGAFADGQALKQNVAISKQGLWPLYVPLYRSVRVFTNLAVTNSIVLKTNKSYFQGSALGWINLSSAPDGNVSWIKTGWTNAINPNGFTNVTAVLGSIYQAPAVGVAPLNATTGPLTLADGNLSVSLDRNYFITNGTKVIITPTNQFVRLSIAPKTGLVKGSFRHPDNENKPAIIYGAVLQQQNFGGGYFLGTNEAGVFLLNP